MLSLLSFNILPGIILLISLQSYLTKDYYVHDEEPSDKKLTVRIQKTESGFQLIRNGKPFYIQGASGNTHFEELNRIGGNTIRVYDTVNLDSILDAAHLANLAVIVDIPLPKFDKNHSLYDDKKYKNNLKRKIKNLVSNYHKHPALLLWILGNEVNYPVFHYKGVSKELFNRTAYHAERNFIDTYNELLRIIHQYDPHHPVSTALAGSVNLYSLASIYINSPNIDLISFNAFGFLKNLGTLLEKSENLFGTRPYFISEWGIDGPWESDLTPWITPIEVSSRKKAEHINNNYKIIADLRDKSCLGSLIFYWGEKHEYTPTWFSLFNGIYKSELMNVLHNYWKKTELPSTPIGLDYMLVDNKGALDSIIFKPNELKSCEIFFNNSLRDSLRIVWDLRPEIWFDQTFHDSIDHSKDAIEAFVSFKNNTATFITPDKEGPYRIYVYVYDHEGYFATTNTPFYILNYE